MSASSGRGRVWADAINTMARAINRDVKERKRLIKEMESEGWIIYESQREEGQMAANYAPIIKSIKEFAQTILEIES